MKKLTLFIPIFLMFVCSCSQNDVDLSLVDSTEFLNSSNETLITKDQAIELAQEAFDKFYPAKSRAERRTVSKSGFIAVTKKGLSRSACNDTTLYIINAEDGKGFVVISPYDKKNPICAVTEFGSITDIENINNPGLKIYLDMYARGPIIRPTTPYNDTIIECFDRVNELMSPPKMNIPWNTFYSAGQFCPNGCCGCVPLSIVMAMAYHERPATLPLTYCNDSTALSNHHENPDRDTLNIDWVSIKQYVQSKDTLDYYGHQLEPKRSLYRQFSFICRQVGHNINATYNPQEFTVASFFSAVNYINNYVPGLSASQIQDGEPNAVTQLGNNIIMIRGKVSGQAIGHMWILDGYATFETHYKVYHIDPFLNPQGTLINEWSEYVYYNHFNWGIGGEGNGFYRFGDYNHTYLNFDRVPTVDSYADISYSIISKTN